MKSLFVIASTSLVLFFGCEKLAEEETPVCKTCTEIRHLTATMAVIDTPQTLKLCGGDVIAWENFSDKVEDSTTCKYNCK